MVQLLVRLPAYAKRMDGRRGAEAAGKRAARQATPVTVVWRAASCSGSDYGAGESLTGLIRAKDLRRQCHQKKTYCFRDISFGIAQPRPDSPPRAADGIRLATNSRMQSLTATKGITGAETLVDALEANGVETIFGLPGLQLDYIFDALYDHQAKIRVIHTRHEQATAYMAFGYAQASGRVGTCLVVPGPGVLNTTAALSTAYACNSP